MFHNDRNSSESTYDPRLLDTTIPVLILGGKENALSLVRNYAKYGITARVSGPGDCWGMFSRHSAGNFRVPARTTCSKYWSELLIDDSLDEILGSLLIPCSDIALEFIAHNYASLSEKFLLDHNKPHLQLKLLDKRETLELANELDISTPSFWNVENEDDLESVRNKVRFPVMVKPVTSHEFIKVFGRKLFIIDEDFDLLAEKVRLSWANNLEVMVMEMIPGPDSLLSSYYTYMDEAQHPQFEYTKSIIRRYPVNRGLACYHKTEWLPKTAELGKKFFSGIGFSGLGNIEFKLDERDNKLKVIESNARFTAAQELIVRSGAPIDLVYYCCATQQPAPSFNNYRENLTYWYGLRDFLAFLQMHREGNITPIQWLDSIFPINHVQPLHNLKDPYPSVGALIARIEKFMQVPGR